MTTEYDLCTLLLKYNRESPESVTVPDFPRLHQESAAAIAKNLSKIIYESYRNDNSESKKNRTAIINLLSRWSKLHVSNHLKITDDNVGAFLNCLDVRRNGRNVQHDYLTELLNAKVPHKDVWTEICERLEERSRIDAEHKLKCDLINALDKWQLQKTGFNCDIQTIIVPSTTETILRSLKSTTNIAGETSTVDNRSVHPDSLIELGYSLLNVKRTTKTDTLLFDIIEKIGGQNELSPTEENFLKYIWSNKDNLGLSDDLCLSIFIKCPVIYEKPLLKVATKVLRADPSMQYELIIDDFDLGRILDICRASDKLMCNVRSVMYEIISLSNFNRGMFVMLDVIQNKLYCE